MNVVYFASFTTVPSEFDLRASLAFLPYTRALHCDVTPAERHLASARKDDAAGAGEGGEPGRQGGAAGSGQAHEPSVREAAPQMIRR